MSVYKVSQIAAGRAGNGNDKFDREYRVVFQVLVNDPYDGIGTVGNAAGIPGRFDPYVGYENGFNDIFALCVHADVAQDGKDWKRWLVTCTFKTNNTKDDQNQQDPMDRPTVRSVSDSDWQRPTYKDRDGKAIQNSSRQIYPGITVEETRHDVHYARNESSIDMARMISFQNSVNSSTFDGIPAGWGKMKISYSERQVENGQAFYKATYTVQVREEGWALVLVDRGTMILDANDNQKVPKDSGEQPLGEVNLDGAGNMLNPGDDPEFLEPVHLLKERNFNSLGLLSNII